MSNWALALLLKPVTVFIPIGFAFVANKLAGAIHRWLPPSRFKNMLFSRIGK